MVERIDANFMSHGTRCGAWHYVPDGAEPRPYVVMAHGLGGTIELGLDDYAQRFAAAGYGVFAFDYRSFGFSDGEPRQVISVQRQLEDWHAALAHVRALPQVDRERIAIWGSSFGGGHVISVAARDHGLAAAIAQVPFADGLQSVFAMPLHAASRLLRAAFVDLARALFDASPRYVPLVGHPGDVALMAADDCHAGFMQLVPPAVAASGRWGNRAAARIALEIGRYSPLRSASSVAAPLLVVAAKTDTVAPAKGAIAVANAAPRGELCLYDKGHFDYYKGAGFAQIIGDELAFLERHLCQTPARLSI